MLVACNCAAAFETDTMMKSSVPPNTPAALSPLMAAYVEATNTFDLERLLATLADDALVNDQLRDYWRKPAIREWAQRDIIGERLTMNITKVINHYENFIVTANVDGNYDKRGLPDPLGLGQPARPTAVGIQQAGARGHTKALEN
jgi:hypothetical protein